MNDSNAMYKSAIEHCIYIVLVYVVISYRYNIAMIIHCHIQLASVTSGCIWIHTLKTLYTAVKHSGGAYRPEGYPLAQPDGMPCSLLRYCV